MMTIEILPTVTTSMITLPNLKTAELNLFPFRFTPMFTAALRSAPVLLVTHGTAVASASPSAPKNRLLRLLAMTLIGSSTPRISSKTKLEPTTSSSPARPISTLSTHTIKLPKSGRWMTPAAASTPMTRMKCSRLISAITIASSMKARLNRICGRKVNGTVYSMLSPAKRQDFVNPTNLSLLTRR